MKLIDPDVEELARIASAQYLIKTKKGTFVCDLDIHKGEVRFRANKAADGIDWIWPVNDPGFISVKEIKDVSED